MITTNAGITYQHPIVHLLHATPLVNAEIAARTAYDSFSSSEHPQIQTFSGTPVEDIPSSELLHQLCHVYFHESVVEHINLTFNIQGTSRGVLQELARHRIASYTVRSTRYTMSSIINAFVASQTFQEPRKWFIDTLSTMDLFVTTDPIYNRIEIDNIYSKLYWQRSQLGSITFNSLAVAKSSLPLLIANLSTDELFNALETGKKKRNIGDPFKHIVTDNFKVDLVMTFNLRSLKNFLNLRDSGAAYFLIEILAKEVKATIPPKYLTLITK